PPGTARGRPLGTERGPSSDRPDLVAETGRCAYDSHGHATRSAMSTQTTSYRRRLCPCTTLPRGALGGSSLHVAHDPAPSTCLTVRSYLWERLRRSPNAG